LAPVGPSEGVVEVEAHDRHPAEHGDAEVVELDQNLLKKIKTVIKSLVDQIKLLSNV